MGSDPESGLEVTKRSGRFGPYIQLGDGKEAKRSSIPKDIAAEDFDLDYALRLLSPPSEVGAHPESGTVIMAALWRCRPSLLHDGNYPKRTGTAESFHNSMHASRVALPESRAGGGRGRAQATPPNTSAPPPVLDDQ